MNDWFSGRFACGNDVGTLENCGKSAPRIVLYCPSREFVYYWTGFRGVLSGWLNREWVTSRHRQTGGIPDWLGPAVAVVAVGRDLAGVMVHADAETVVLSAVVGVAERRPELDDEVGGRVVAQPDRRAADGDDEQRADSAQRGQGLSAQQMHVAVRTVVEPDVVDRHRDATLRQGRCAMPRKIADAGDARAL